MQIRLNGSRYCLGRERLLPLVLRQTHSTTQETAKATLRIAIRLLCLAMYACSPVKFNGKSYQKSNIIIHLIQKNVHIFCSSIVSMNIGRFLHSILKKFARPMYYFPIQSFFHRPATIFAPSPWSYYFPVLANRHVQTTDYCDMFCHSPGGVTLPSLPY